MLNARDTYKNSSINNVSKEKLLIMLVEGGVKFCKIAKLAFKTNNLKEIHTNLVKAQDIFYELMITLDTEKGGVWAENLKSIYAFIIDRLSRCNIEKNEAILDEVFPVVQEVNDMWQEVYKKVVNSK
ncbi:flagellar protein FliS [Candidatus Arthromitus sp. SFB-mouse-Japan]|uniref:flagellar export chaperone FliS n=1 Tax=unclassified Candidatus Neoarthromitus TaxID=2638829 RepID=UPI00021B7FA4|nr:MULTISPECIES: flagellar export chaperone FliS [unclassified Candidatus Arthromitus]EIA22329.1 Flagellar protein FliS [Candidatus Arthromitus sp. SFB-1]EIA24665.1 Flagellar protein FliS [Candidatus Arthromitus sp. SFB-2]EIA26593.1 Flagellar protein FliS [Candidatus Arthromitus sp. SFB-5]EIA28147.1 Flagellar protein FliS [Candidatus Arthromitus sp. SFB-co]EIA29565.1 Flagellar protein FliS [Candidatus Arthromitus sp. SFB-4]EIA30629.1 Flagellar protein FliS [Candidatus Arthromitus sp. SFB-mous